MSSIIIIVSLVLMAFAIDNISAGQCFGLHCAGNNLGLTSSLLGYLQLGNVGVAQVGGGRYFYRRYKERASHMGDETAPIQAMTEELDEDRKMAILDLIDEELPVAPRPRSGEDKPMEREERDRIVEFVEDAAKDGYEVAKGNIDAIEFARETMRL